MNEDNATPPAWSPAEFQEKVGSELGVSPWLIVTQDMIDAFAEATGDHQFIHVDPVRAAQTPFGGTIAHGFLSLSLMPRLAAGAGLPRPAALKMAVNYGGNKVRFLTPVRSGAKVRGRFRLLAFEDRGGGRWQQEMEYVLEIEGADKPALTAEWISLYFTA